MTKVNWQMLLCFGFLLGWSACGPARQAPPEDPGAIGDDSSVTAERAAQERASDLMGKAGFAIADENDGQALEYYLAAAAILDGLGRVTIEQGEAHFMAAGVAQRLYQNEQAIKEYEAAVNVYLRFSGKSRIKGIAALTNMGMIYKAMGDSGKARSCWERALNNYRAAPPDLQSERNIKQIEKLLQGLSSGY